MTDEKKKHPGGRPTKFEEWMIEDVVELGQKGYCKVQIASKYDVTPNTLDNWGKKNPKFLSALARAKTHAISHMIKLAHENLNNRNYQSKLWEIMMRFVHGCKEDRNPIIVDFDECKTLEDKCDKIISHTLQGSISPDHCEKLIRSVCARANLKIEEIERRVEEIQTRLKNS